METFNLRKKLIQQFDHFIKDDDKLVALEGVLDALDALDSTNTSSKIPSEHYDMINESRDLYLKADLPGISWYEVKENLISKYGL